MAEGPGALDGVNVVESGGFVGALYAARCLADLGATIIEVEPPEGDPSRRHGPFSKDIPHPGRADSAACSTPTSWALPSISRERATESASTASLPPPTRSSRTSTRTTLRP